MVEMVVRKLGQKALGGHLVVLRLGDDLEGGGVGAALEDQVVGIDLLAGIELDGDIRLPGDERNVRYDAVSETGREFRKVLDAVIPSEVAGGHAAPAGELEVYG